MHEAVMQLTAHQAGRQWVQFVSETTQLLVLHELDSHMAAPLLTTHMTNVLAWLLCLYYFNTPGQSRCCCFHRLHALMCCT